MLAGGGEVGAHQEPAVGTVEGAPAAAGLRLDLDRADVLLALVVGEGDGEVVQEAQDVGSAALYAVGNLAGEGLLGSGRWGWAAFPQATAWS
ncbi:hypothetical protein [Streptomyces sp. F001]|uniref:hypothetical protein n=1 Tax=Streptomyces sp. F001 TaxID=1510026 RepID=UPI001F0FFAF0|nr:hypothetical protein [Streptomyces sp. F001]